MPWIDMMNHRDLACLSDYVRVRITCLMAGCKPLKYLLYKAFQHRLWEGLPAALYDFCKICAAKLQDKHQAGALQHLHLHVNSGQPAH